MERAAAVDRVNQLLDAVEGDPLPVPIREVWVYGDLALGLDPIDRLDVYLRKDMLFASELSEPHREERFEQEYGIAGIGTTINAQWAETYPDRIQATSTGYAAPERCLAAHLVTQDEPIHLEICNAGFEQNVRQRLKGATARDAWEEVLDPRAVCLYQEGTRSETASARLRAGEYVFPPLPEALEILGLSSSSAAQAAEAVSTYRTSQEGRSVRGDVLAKEQ